MFNEGDYEAAGEYFVEGLFPIQKKKVGNVKWGDLPYRDAHDGEEIAGALSGIIYAFLHEENYDYLLKCAENQRSKTFELNKVFDTLMKRTDKDVLKFMVLF